MTVDRGLRPALGLYKGRAESLVRCKGSGNCLMCGLRSASDLFISAKDLRRVFVPSWVNLGR